LPDANPQQLTPAAFFQAAIDSAPGSE